MRFVYDLIYLVLQTMLLGAEMLSPIQMERLGGCFENCKKVDSCSLWDIYGYMCLLCDEYIYDG